MHRTLGRDLRAVGDCQKLRAPGQPGQAFADSGGHGTADTPVDFVENDRCRTAFFGQRNLQRQNEPRQLAA